MEKIVIICDGVKSILNKEKGYYYNIPHWDNAHPDLDYWIWEEMGDTWGDESHKIQTTAKYNFIQLIDEDDYKVQMVDYKNRIEEFEFYCGDGDYKSLEGLINDLKGLV